MLKLSFLGKTSIIHIQGDLNNLIQHQTHYWPQSDLSTICLCRNRINALFKIYCNTENWELLPCLLERETLDTSERPYSTTGLRKNDLLKVNWNWQWMTEFINDASIIHIDYIRPRKVAHAPVCRKFKHPQWCI